MSKLFKILIALTMILVFTVGCSNQAPEINMDKYSNRFFEIDYPETWKYEEDMEPIFITNFHDPDNEIKININISSLQEGISEEEQLDLFKEEIENVEDEIDIDLLESNNITIDEYGAIEVIFIYWEEQKVQRIMTTFEGHIMSIEARSEKDDFDEYQEIINDMVDSIKIIYED